MIFAREHLSFNTTVGQPPAGLELSSQPLFPAPVGPAHPGPLSLLCAQISLSSPGACARARPQHFPAPLPGPSLTSHAALPGRAETGL